MNLENKKKIVLDLIGTFQTASKLSCLLYTSDAADE